MLKLTTAGVLVLAWLMAIGPARAEPILEVLEEAIEGADASFSLNDAGVGYADVTGCSRCPLVGLRLRVNGNTEAFLNDDPVPVSKVANVGGFLTLFYRVGTTDVSRILLRTN